MKKRYAWLRLFAICLALLIGAALVPCRHALAEEGPEAFPIDLDAFSRKNCVSCFLALRGRVTLLESRSYGDWRLDVESAYQNRENGVAWWSLADYSGDEYMRRSQVVFLPGAVPQRTELVEDASGYRTLDIWSPHSAELFAETYLVYGYDAVLYDYGTLYLGEGTSDGQTDTWEIFATMGDAFYARGIYDVNRWTGLIERASVSCYQQDGNEEENYTLQVEDSAGERFWKDPGSYSEETGTVSVTLEICHEDGREEKLTYLVMPGTEIVYMDDEEFTAYLDAEKMVCADDQNPFSVSFGSVYEDVTFYISAI